MTNNKWCNPKDITTLSRSCSLILEHLTISCHPFYLPREFSTVIITAVYIPPQAYTDMALSALHDVLCRHQTQHPDVAVVVPGDFNRANLKKVMPNFHQHIMCAARGEGTLDHCHMPFKRDYKAVSLPLSKSDHAAFFLLLEYKQWIVREAVVTRDIKQ